MGNLEDAYGEKKKSKFKSGMFSSMKTLTSSISTDI